MAPPSPASVVAFVALVIVNAACVVGAVRSARTHWTLPAIITVIVVLTATTGLAESGVLESQRPPPVLFVFVGMLLTVVALAFSRIGSAIGAALSVRTLIVFHVFRLPLELILAWWHSTKTIPEQMTFHGYNFDIVTGMLALVIGLAFFKRDVPKRLAISFHLVGLFLVITVAGIALLSAPTPLKQFDGTPLTLPFHAPFIWIMPFAVGVALLAHIVALRTLAQRQRGAVDR